MRRTALFETHTAVLLEHNPADDVTHCVATEGQFRFFSAFMVGVIKAIRYHIAVYSPTTGLTKDYLYYLMHTNSAKNASFTARFKLFKATQATQREGRKSGGLMFEISSEVEQNLVQLFIYSRS